MKRDVAFIPSLPTKKSNTIRRMGIGYANRIALIFPSVFWDDKSIIVNSSDEPFIIFNIYKLRKHKILLVLFYGETASNAENKTNAQLVQEIMDFLKKVSN